MTGSQIFSVRPPSYAMSMLAFAVLKTSTHLFRWPESFPPSSVCVFPGFHADHKPPHSKSPRPRPRWKVRSRKLTQRTQVISTSGVLRPCVGSPPRSDCYYWQEISPQGETSQLLLLSDIGITSVLFCENQPTRDKIRLDKDHI